MQKILFVISFLFLTLQSSHAQTRAECNFEWRVCKASGPSNYASECWEPNGVCYEKAKRNITPAKTVCFKEYESCIYNDCGSYGDSEIVPCARRCLRKEQECQRAAAKPPPQPTYISPKSTTQNYGSSTTYTPPKTKSPTYGSGYKPPTTSSGVSDNPISNNEEQTVEDALRGVFGKPVQSEYGSGYVPPNTSTEESDTPSEITKEDIRKKLGMDLETMKAVSDIGSRNALNCTTLQRNSKGWLEVFNGCGETINYGYCYSEWVPKRELGNPFKCDLTGKPSWSGASSVAGSSTRQFPSQGDSKSMRANFGPCMEKVIYNNRTYSYLSSRRTTTGPFNGMGGKYKCIYQKSAGQN